MVVQQTFSILIILSNQLLFLRLNFVKHQYILAKNPRFKNHIEKTKVTFIHVTWRGLMMSKVELLRLSSSKRFLLVSFPIMFLLRFTFTSFFDVCSLFFQLFQSFSQKSYGLFVSFLVKLSPFRDKGSQINNHFCVNKILYKL